MKTKPVQFIFGFVMLGVAYFLGSRALDTGSYWQYLGSFCAFIAAIKLFVQSFKGHGTKD